MPKGIIALLALGSLFPPDASRRWSAEGHEIICEIAWLRLTGEAKTMIRDLRRGDPDPTFSESCVWADEVRSTTHPNTAPYHYVNIAPGSPGFDPDVDCGDPERRCVTWAIQHYADVLNDRSESRHSRNEALKFLAHFVGDLHQPLHAGRFADLGGNRTEVEFFGDEGNLHAVWDVAIIARAGYTWPASAQPLNDEVSEAQASEWEGFDPVQWTNESYEIVEDFVYEFPATRVIGESYYRRAAEISTLRMQQAGVRLASVLNRIAAGEGF